MTYEERKEQVCKECSWNTNGTCSYIMSKMQHKCQRLCDTMYGWQMGYKDASDVARKFLTKDLNKALEEGYK